jgi:hypothetical protein
LEEKKLALRKTLMELDEKELLYKKGSIELDFNMVKGYEGISTITDRERVWISDIKKFMVERHFKSQLQPITRGVVVENGHGTVEVVNHQQVQQPLQQQQQVEVRYENKEISIAYVLQTMGLTVENPNTQYSLIGKEMKKLWKERYPKETPPPKGKQPFQGKVVEVNTYYEKDRDLMEKAIKKVLNKK